MRKERILGGKWDFFKGCSDFASLKDISPKTVTIPHTWNNLDGQDGGNDYYRGTCCYRKLFPRPAFEPSHQLYIHFDAVNASAEVYFNGTRIFSHDGGYSAFNVRIDHLLLDDNELIVFADNGRNDKVYPQNADFTFYGGIYREVKLICVESTHFDFGSFGGQGIKLTPVVDGKLGRLNARAWVSGNYDDVRFSVYDGRTKVASGSGVDCNIVVPDVHLWNGLEDPFLYRVVAELILDDEVVDSLEHNIGFRFFEFDAEKGFFLNGRSYPLRGVSRHQDRLKIGNALTRKMHEEDLALILEVGANSIRLAHYQHDQYFYDLCDKAGVVCWAEIPYITKHMDGGFENTMSQLSELIEQCYNHACIVCWGISNEITAGGNSQELYDNNMALYNRCHELDSLRPVAMAHAFMLPISNKVVTLPDIAGYNLYYGWYLGEMEDNGKFLDSCHQAHPELPLGLTEFGCDANPKLQTSKPAKGDYTEQYQAKFHDFMCSEIEKRPYLWGTYIWNMFDFAADARDEGGTKGRNNKGLVTFDRKLRKDAFYAVKAWYSKEPFVYISGRRYTDRCEDVTQVIVYSNQERVELLANGQSLGTKTGRHSFVFDVKLTGEVELEARSGDLSDRIKIRKVDLPNKSYVLAKTAEIENWFAGLNITEREGYLSVNDKIGTLLKSPESKVVFYEVLKKREGNMAEGVGSQVKLTEEMVEMTMKDIQLIEVLRRSRFTYEDIKEINKKLNEIERGVE